MQERARCDARWPFLGFKIQSQPAQFYHLKNHQLDKNLTTIYAQLMLTVLVQIS